MRHILLLFLIGFISTLFGGVGKVTSLQGDVSIKRGSDTFKVVKSQEIEKKDEIFTKGAAKVKIKFEDGTIISLGKNAVFSVADYFYEEGNAQAKADFSMTNGVFRAITGRIGKIAPDKFKIRTKTATIGIRGTIIIGRVTSKGDKIGCDKGAISVKTPFGKVEFKAGSFTSVKPGQAPTKPAPFNASFSAGVKKDTALGDDDSSGDDSSGSNDSGDDGSGDDGSGDDDSGDDGSGDDDSGDDGSSNDDSGDDGSGDDGSGDDGSGDDGSGDSGSGDDGSGDSSSGDDSSGDSGSGDSGTSDSGGDSSATGSSDSSGGDSTSGSTTPSSDAGSTDTGASTPPNTPTTDTSSITNEAASQAAQETVTNTVTEAAEETASEVAEDTVSEGQFFAKTHQITVTDDGSSVGKTWFTVTEETTVTIATHGPNTDPEMFLLRKNDSGAYTSVANDDDGWTIAGGADNSIISQTLEPGDYAIAISIYHFSEEEAEGIDGSNNQSYYPSANITLHISADKSITLTGYDEDYTGASGIGTKAYTMTDSPVSNTLTDKLIFGVLEDSIAGTTVASSDGIYVSIPDDPNINDIEKLLVEDSSYTGDYSINGTYLGNSYNTYYYPVVGTEIDNDSSWGYWMPNIDYNIRSRDYVWVSGTLATAAELASVVNTTPNLKYSGHVIGSIDNDPILLNSKNKVELYFFLSYAIINGLIEFEDSGSDFWSVAVTGSTGNDDFTLTPNALASKTYSGSASGSFFGSDASSVGGKFDFSKLSGNSRASGVFLANQKEEVVGSVFTGYQVATLKGDSSSTEDFVNADDLVLVLSDVQTSGAAYDSSSLDTSTYTMTSTFKDTNGDSHTGSYDVYQDNKGEFFIGIASPVNPISISNADYSYNDVFYAGTLSDGSTIDANTLYHYKDIVSLEFESENGVLSKTTLKTDRDFAFRLNGFLKTIGYTEKPSHTVTQDNGVDIYNYNSFYGAKEFESITVADTGAITGTNINKNSSYVVDVDSIKGQVYGSEFQGIGVYSDEFIGAANLVSTETFTPKTESVTLDGFVSQTLSTGVNSTGDLSITIERSGTNAGAISVDTSSLYTASELSFNGTIGEHTSSYVSDDNFGVVGAGAIAAANSAFMVTRADTFTFDVGGTLTSATESDDYSSWGYWTASIDNVSTSSIDQVQNTSTWVAGELTTTTQMAAQIASETNVAYSGHVLGHVSIGTSSIEPILVNTQNQVSMNFDLSAGTMTGTIGFETASTSWSESISSGTVSGSSFSFDLDTSSGSTGSGVGKFFGPNVDSVGGHFSATKVDVSNNTLNANAVFKAAKAVAAVN